MMMWWAASGSFRWSILRVALVCGCLLAPLVPHAQGAAALRAQMPPPHAIWAESLNLRYLEQEWGVAHAGKSVDGHPLTLCGIRYPHGIGTHANSQFIIDLQRAAVRFTAMVGVDDEVKTHGSVVFTIEVDGKPAADSGVLHGGEAPMLLSVDLTGARRMILRVTAAGADNTDDHADWAGALIALLPDGDMDPAAVEDEPDIASARPSPVPAIHGPRIVGGSPGCPFLYRIPATGDAPLTYAAEGLPDGLTLDRATGIITGQPAREGASVVALTVQGPRGADTRKLTILIGQRRIALTPPLGWNSWNVWGDQVTDARMRAAADALVRSGLAAHGYQYVNLDDGWSREEDGRDAHGAILPNAKFPDMRALADIIHQYGLKFGIYTSPGYRTCAGDLGSSKHEQQDADTFARWGADYLKYDWCTAEERDTLLPFRTMRAALDRCGRDMVFSLSESGEDRVWEWGEQVGGNCWRTNDDIRDTWESIADIGFGQNEHGPYAGPGHWNDLDMLVVGQIGWGTPHMTRLSKHEQVTHLTLWSLNASPLLIGCDLTQLDDFTRDLLSNDDMLAVDQDPLGTPAHRVAQQDGTEVWARPLWDGTFAVGLFNRTAMHRPVTVRWSSLGLRGPQPVRDCWKRAALGSLPNTYTTDVGPHGAALLIVGTPNGADAYLPPTK